MGVIARHIEKMLASDSSEEARRLFHGRGHCYPGYEFLTIDYYPPLIHVVCHEKREAAWTDALVSAVFAAAKGRVETVVVQSRQPAAQEVEVHGDASRLAGACALEDGLRFRLDLRQPRNIGFFPDMREGRRFVRTHAQGKRVLNLFAYTCGFSVAALGGGASQVVNVDMSRTALARGRENHLLNGLDLRRASFLDYEIFRSFGKLARLGPFDLVVIDPPTYQGKSFQVDKDYGRLLRRLERVAGRKATILACLNAPHRGVDFVKELFQKEAPAAVCRGVLPSAADFPECQKETRGLTMLHYQME